jgi:hypothetical protein
MKEYLKYILIGLAIAIVIGLGYYAIKRIDKLEEKLTATEAELFTVRNYMNSEKKLADNDVFSANTQRNISLEINNSMPSGRTMPSGQGNISTNNQAPINRMSEEFDDNESGSSAENSVDVLNSEINNLRNDITNIEDLIQDSSYESSNNGSVDLDAEEYENQLNNINTVNSQIDDSLIEQVEQVKEYTQQISGSQNEEYQKNNNSEFEDLANVDLEHNSEFDELLVNDATTNNEDEENVSEDEEEVNQSEEEGSQDEDEIQDALEINSQLKNELDVNVISNLYSKRQLENLCTSNNLSKQGNKITLVQRLIDNNVKLIEGDDELTTVNSS